MEADPEKQRLRRSGMRNFAESTTGLPEKNAYEYFIRDGFDDCGNWIACSSK